METYTEMTDLRRPCKTDIQTVYAILTDY